MLAIYLACFATGAMALFFICWMENMHQKERLDTIARKNLLYMETMGCLSGEVMSGMEEELRAAGFENLDFSGTTTEEVGYGAEISLNIRGTVRYSLFKNGSGIVKRTEITVPVSIHLSSTAKH